ncbi:hypothetical protein GGS21DRAFT_543828 [Xylaria nigripes]|nr:hypothetical protein GGS21DRAFT_543828 [Xylaria nigripes]
MPPFASSILSAAAALALIQSCPAPFPPPGTGAPEPPFQSVAPRSAKRAIDAISAAGGVSGTVMSSRNVLVEGMPPPCVALAPGLQGRYAEGNPVPMGCDSVLFQNVSQPVMRDIQDALDAHCGKF